MRIPAGLDTYISAVIGLGGFFIGHTTNAQSIRCLVCTGI
jgi:hypothetical protein